MDNNNHGLSEKTDRPSSRGRLPDGSAHPFDTFLKLTFMSATVSAAAAPCSASRRKSWPKNWA